jgi:hypothetical protein
VGVSGTATGSGGVGVRGNGTTWDFEAGHNPARLSWNASSIRWKDNIQPIQGALDKILDLRGVTFDWDAAHGGSHGLGLIAEEVGAAFPELVTYEADGQHATSVDYSKFTAVLLEAVKELKAENDALKARIEALEKKK